MTVAHYRQPNVSEEDFHRWVTEEHGARAAKLRAKNGLEGFSIFFAPKSFQDMTSELDGMRGNPWRFCDFDAQVEFLFRDMETFYKGAADADFQALQAEEEPYVSHEGAEVSIKWIETYVRDNKVVNPDESGKPAYPPFKDMSVAP